MTDQQWYDLMQNRSLTTRRRLNTFIVCSYLTEFLASLQNGGQRSENPNTENIRYTREPFFVFQFEFQTAPGATVGQWVRNQYIPNQAQIIVVCELHTTNAPIHYVGLMTGSTGPLYSSGSGSSSCTIGNTFSNNYS